jgi:uncharacterized protein YjbI with pentapeptide repeats
VSATLEDALSQDPFGRPSCRHPRPMLLMLAVSTALLLRLASGSIAHAQITINGCTIYPAIPEFASTPPPQCPGVNLSGTDLRGAKLNGADLTGADLSSADLGCFQEFLGPLVSPLFGPLVCAELSGANLSGANLSSANLDGAQLNGANLSSANLSGVVGVLGQWAEAIYP